MHRPPSTSWPTTCLLLNVLAGNLGAADAPVDRFHGDYTAAGAPVVQVVALGDDAYRAHVLPTLERREKPLAVLLGKVEGDQVVFTAAPTDQKEKGGSWWAAPASSAGWSATLAGGMFTLKPPDAPVQALKPLDRRSPTLGAKPPADALVLLGPETKDLGQLWVKVNTTQPLQWTLVEPGLMEVAPGKGSAQSIAKFGSHHLHVEFRLAFEPKHRGQGRSNSGVYVQGRYEIQVLDSYGLEGVMDECGGIYKASKPIVNRCLPPGQWQTYDVDFTTSVWDNGQMTKPAVISVLHNGLPIHQNLELPHGTPGGCAMKPGADGHLPPEGLVLQDHHSAVQYRNIWAVVAK